MIQYKFYRFWLYVTDMEASNTIKINFDGPHTSDKTKNNLSDE